MSTLGTLASHFKISQTTGDLRAYTPDLQIYDRETQSFKDLSVQIESEDAALQALMKAFDALPESTWIKTYRRMHSEYFTKQNGAWRQHPSAPQPEELNAPPSASTQEPPPEPH